MIATSNESAQATSSFQPFEVLACRLNGPKSPLSEIAGNMHKNTRKPYQLTLIPITAMLVVGCAQERHVRENTSNMPQFSLEDRRAARSLSIDNRQDIISYKSRYLQSLSCETAVYRLGKIMREMSMMDNEKERALLSAEKRYTLEVAKAAASEGKSPNDVRLDRESQRKNETDRVTEIQTGMVCIRALLG